MGGLESGEGTRSGETVEGIHSCSRKGRAALRGAGLTRPQGSLGVKRRTRDALTKAPSRAAGRPVFLGREFKREAPRQDPEADPPTTSRPSQPWNWAAWSWGGQDKLNA